MCVCATTKPSQIALCFYKSHVDRLLHLAQLRTCIHSTYVRQLIVILNFRKFNEWINQLALALGFGRNGEVPNRAMENALSTDSFRFQSFHAQKWADNVLRAATKMCLCLKCSHLWLWRIGGTWKFSIQTVNVCVCVRVHSEACIALCATCSLLI